MIIFLICDSFIYLLRHLNQAVSAMSNKTIPSTYNK